MNTAASNATFTKEYITIIVTICIIIFIVQLAIAIVACVKAQKKGYNGLLWFFVGFFFTLLGLLILDALPDRTFDKIMKIPVALYALDNLKDNSNLSEEYLDTLREDILSFYDL